LCSIKDVIFFPHFLFKELGSRHSFLLFSWSARAEANGQKLYSYFGWEEEDAILFSIKDGVFFPHFFSKELASIHSFILFSWSARAEVHGCTLIVDGKKKMLSSFR
jgi:hypothetical protein